MLLLARCEAGLAAMADGGCGALPLVLARPDLDGEDCGGGRSSQILTLNRGCVYDNLNA